MRRIAGAGDGIERKNQPLVAEGAQRVAERGRRRGGESAGEKMAVRADERGECAQRGGVVRGEAPQQHEAAGARHEQRREVGRREVGRREAGCEFKDEEGGAPRGGAKRG